MWDPGKSGAYVGITLFFPYTPYLDWGASKGIGEKTAIPTLVLGYHPINSVKAVKLPLFYISLWRNEDSNSDIYSQPTVYKNALVQILKTLLHFLE